MANSNPPAERPDFLEGAISHRDKAALMFADFQEFLSARAEDPAAITDELNRLNLMAILEAETEEEMWAADGSELPGGRDLPEVEQTIRGYRVLTAGDRFNAPLGHFILVDAVRLEDGKEFIWNTGTPMLIGKIRWLEANNKLPYDCVIKGIDSQNGTRLRLMPVPKRPVKATVEK